MATLEEIRAESSWADLIEGQPQHAAIALLMGVGACGLMVTPDDPGRFLGLTARDWAVTSIVLAVLHQAIVAVVFRLQLHRNLMTRLFGDRDMHAWRALFMPFLAARPVTVLCVALADGVAITGWRPAEIGVGLALIAAAVWAMHSVLVYFTLPRALGGDHFRDEYAAMPLVREGAFAVTSNAMYGIVFLGLWGIALALGSWNALVVALFQHGFIWVHMYCTEAPDMRRIYG